MKLTELENGHWLASYYLGKRQRRLKGSNRKQLEEQVNKEVYEYNQRGITPDVVKQRSTVEEICDGYWQDHVVEGEVKNKAAVKSAITLFKSMFPHTNVRDLTTDMVETAFKKYAKATHPRIINDERINLQNSSSAVKKMFGLFRAILNWGIKKGFLHSNPCKNAKKYQDNDTFPRFLSKEECKTLVSNGPKRFFDYCFLVLRTGMRPGEALNLSWSHIDMDGGRIYFTRQQRLGLSQKNNKKGTIKISPKLALWLRKRAKVSQEGLVLNYTKQQLRNDAEAAIEASGINKVIKPGTAAFTIYGLRHTFASHLLMAGEKIDVVAEILRHSDINITFKHYKHLVDDMKSAAMEKVDLLDDGFELKVVGE